MKKSRTSQETKDLYQTIRDVTPLIDYCSNNGISLRSIGSSYRCNSPFTDGRNAFSIRKDSPEIWYDFSLTASKEGQEKSSNWGDVIDLCAWLYHKGDKKAALHDLIQGMPEEQRLRLSRKINRYMKDMKAEQDKIQLSHDTLLSGEISTIAHWMEYLHGRGIDDTQIRRLKLGLDINSSRLLIPRFNFNGSEVLYHKTRRMPDASGKINEDDAPYLNAKLEDNTFLRNIPLGLQTLNRTSQYLVLCEGDFDFMNFEHDGFAVLGSGGGSFSAQQWQEYVMGAAEKFEAVVLAFDTDEPGQDFTKTVAEKLFAANIPFSVISLPDGCKDVNDYYREALSAGQEKSCLQELIEDAVQGLEYLVKIYAPAVDFDRMSRRKKDKIQEDLKKFLINAQRGGCEEPELIMLCSKLSGCYPPDWLKSIITQAKKGETEYNIVEEFRKEHDLLYNERTGFYEYDRQRGIWIPKDDTAIGESVRYFVGHSITSKRMISITEHLKRAVVSTEPVEKFNRLLLFAFANGTLHIKVEKQEDLFRPASSSDFVTSRRDYEYNSEAKCPEWEKALEAIMLGDQKRISCFQEFCGYCLLNHCKYEKALILRDPQKTGSNGKSTILAVVRAVLGEDTCTSLEPAEFADVHSLIKLKDARVNICTDAAPYIGGGSTNLRKAITGKDMLRGRGLYRDFIEFQNTAKIIFAINGNLKLKDDDNAEPLKRRFLLIDCLAHFVEEPNAQNTCEFKKDFNALEKLMKEKSGIFNWMLEGANRLIRNRGHFTLTDEHCRDMECAFEADTDHIGIFIDEAAFADKKKVKLTWGNIEGRYSDFCSKEGFEALSKKKFHHIFREKLIEKGVRFRQGQNNEGLICIEFLG